MQKTDLKFNVEERVKMGKEMDCEKGIQKRLGGRKVQFSK